jgi:hypothetical protein
MFRKLIIFVVLVSISTPVFAQSVETAWIRKHRGAGIASAIAVDSSGNIYVTGNWWNGNSFDYATIKYYSNGDTAWVRSYDGPGDSQEAAYAIAVDGSGGVYVTGISSIGIGADSGDYATIKYYSNGDTAWVRRYNGPGNGNDMAYGIAVDGSGSVYVTGASQGSGTGYDYATIKYRSWGDIAWVRRYNGPGNGDDWASDAIAVDGSGNVYVAGFSTGSATGYDYTTIKYRSNGDTAWVRSYNGNDGDDLACGIAVDGYGHVYVTGYSTGSGTGYDYTTIKYYSNRDTAWVRSYDGPGNLDDVTHAITVDGSGNVYVTGTSSTGIGADSGDYATIKYYSNGGTAWVRRYNGPGKGVDEARAMAVDGSGSVYVTGWSYGSGTKDDFATVKYHSNGDIAWVKRYDGLDIWRDKAWAIAVDGSGNVYVTGSSMCYVTIKYVQFLRGDANER